MSYARFNDQHDDGQLTQFRERLAAEVRVQTGEEFAIFQDRNDIAWGQNWQARIDQALDAVTLLLVVITPSFFRSPACRGEVERFLARERELGRQDLILPVYYVSTPDLDRPERRDADELARVLASRQFADWRELRFEPFTAPVVRKALAQLARRMCDTFWHPPPARPAHAGQPEPAATPATESESATQQAARAGPVVKTEPPTHVVDAYGRADFVTITAAIKAARPGDRILVRPGLYQEGLVIDKPLEILGEGPVQDIEVQARATNVLLFKTNISRVANLTLRQVGGPGDWYGVDITQGRLELEGCVITSESLSCVAIHGGADPRLRRNQIHDGKQSGVYVYENGLGTLEDNDITANQLTGVTITTGGNPTLRRNQIHDGRAGGVFVYENGLGTLEDNDITTNQLSGVEITTGGNPTLRRNQIHDNKNPGVFVWENGLGTLEDNDITANQLSGVEIKTGGNPTLRRNQIHDGKQNGVFVQENGLGTLEDNDITANQFSGVAIKTGGDPTLRRNRINRNEYQAVWSYEGGRGVVEDNDLTDNERGAFDIAEDSKANMRVSGNRT
jgi:F-box protein 11